MGLDAIHTKLPTAYMHTHIFYSLHAFL